MTEQKYVVTEEPAVRTMAVRTRTSARELPQEIGRVFHAIMAYMDELGESLAGAPYVAYFNLDMDDLEVEMGFPVAQALPGKAEVEPSEIPAGKWLSTMHKGPYEQMASCYEGMTQWLACERMEASGVAYEYYYNSPDEVPENELLTKIAFLLK